MPNMTIEHSMICDTVTHPESFILINLDQFSVLARKFL